jgi:3',5'-cyclic AMP phosphodiesterase CpdA
MFTLAHLSDPHIGPLPTPTAGELLSKRILGFLSWTLNRRRLYRMAALEALTKDLAAAAPDHIAVTGDIVNISLPAEFDHATQWLKSLGAADRVTVVPGNHDAYVAMPWRDTIGQWADYMATTSLDDGAGGEAPLPGAECFPFVRLRGEVALVGLNTACPTPPGFAGGRVGAGQTTALRDKLLELGRRGLCRVVLIHHPPFGDPRHRRKELEDHRQVRDCIAEAGAELVLHGHTHRSGLSKIGTPRGHAPVIGVPAASAQADHGSKDHARYHLYGISRDGAGWRIQVEVRGFTGTRNSVATEGMFTLAVP